jgi:hypothetical protein
MQIKAEIIADSKNEFGNRITTMVVTFPRIILAEFNTHRMLSKNSASSRAIPFEKMVKSVHENPFIPIAWQIDHKGMQGTEYLTDHSDIFYAIDKWLAARDWAITYSEKLNSRERVTKQLCNRLLEPFMYHTVIVTATEWENFFNLRCPRYEYVHGIKIDTHLNKTFKSKKDFKNYAKEMWGNVPLRELEPIEWLKLNKGQSEIHMMALAECMWDAYNESTPKQLKAGEWHIPFQDKIKLRELATEEDILDGTLNRLEVKVSTMMCARVSYTTISTESSEWSYEKYIAKYDELVSANPIHASPLEHCAPAMSVNEYQRHYKGELDNLDEPSFNENYRGWSNNFKGFIQLRELVENKKFI